MSYTTRVYRQRNAHTPDESRKEPFFAKQNDSGSTHKGSGFFQAKLTVNAPGDSYEQEADSVASAVVNKSTAGPVLQHKKISSLQRLATSAEEEKLGTNDARMARDKEIQEKPMQLAPAEPEKEKQEEIQKAGIPEKEQEEAVQKKDAPKPEEEEKPVQAKSGAAPSAAPAHVASKIASTAGGGQALPAKALKEMSGSFGADFSNVRIHKDGDAAGMNKELNAQAFTHGSDIYFNEGKFDPESHSGKFLLAHELTHVVQQGMANGDVQKKDGGLQLQPVPGSGAAAGGTSCGKNPDCPNTFCEPFPNRTAALLARAATEDLLLAGISRAVNPRVVPLWKQYIDGGAAPQDLSAKFGADFMTSRTTADTTAFLVSSLRAALISSLPSFPSGANVMKVDIPSLIPAAVAEIDTDKAANEMNFNVIGEVPGNIAGGIGKTQASCPVGAKPSPFDDARIATGNATLIKIGDAVTVIPVISYEVKDTIDLCPGNCGAAIEMGATIPLSKMEVSGISGDVPFTVKFPSMPVSPFTFNLPSSPVSPATKGTVNASVLNIREHPNTSSAILGHYNKGEAIEIKCRVSGQPVEGVSDWYQTDRGFISGRYVKISSGKPSDC